MTGALMFAGIWLIGCLLVIAGCALVRYGRRSVTLKGMPKIEVIEMHMYGSDDSFRQVPSPTMHLLWRLYPSRVARGNAIVHPGFIHAQIALDKVFIFMLHEGKALTFEDDVNVFPSDVLVTKIRLVIGNLQG